MQNVKTTPSKIQALSAKYILNKWPISGTKEILFQFNEKNSNNDKTKNNLPVDSNQTHTILHSKTTILSHQ